jgi:hypothetical protein
MEAEKEEFFRCAFLGGWEDRLNRARYPEMTEEITLRIAVSSKGAPS